MRLLQPDYEWDVKRPLAQITYGRRIRRELQEQRLNRMIFNAFKTELVWSERLLDLDKIAAKLGIDENDTCNYTRVVTVKLWEARTLL